MMSCSVLYVAPALPVGAGYSEAVAALMIRIYSLVARPCPSPRHQRGVGL